MTGAADRGDGPREVARDERSPGAAEHLHHICWRGRIARWRRVHEGQICRSAAGEATSAAPTGPGVTPRTAPARFASENGVHGHATRGLRSGLSVRIPGPLRPGRHSRPVLPGRSGRTTDDDPLHRALADLLGQLPQQGRGQQPDLSRPGGGVRRHGQHPLGKAQRGAVSSDVSTDHSLPATEDSTHSHRLGPAAFGHQTGDRGGHTLWITGVRTGSRAGVRTVPAFLGPSVGRGRSTGLTRLFSPGGGRRASAAEGSAHGIRPGIHRIHRFPRPCG